MKPIIPPKYNVGISINNSNDKLLEALEPWCSKIYVDNNFESYINLEQAKTSFNLKEKINTIGNLIIKINKLQTYEKDLIKL